MRRRWLRSDEKKKVPSPSPEAAAPVAFFKFMYIDFQNVMFIPPKFVPNLEDLTGRDVYLEDSEGNYSKVRMAVVDGSLAFHEGWSDFVSGHSIQLGELLLFQYTSKSSFSVRVFGLSACERAHFHIESKSRSDRKKRKESSSSLEDLHTPKRSQNSEDLDGNCCVSGEDPKSKGPETRLDGSSLTNGEIGHSNSAAEASDVDPETPRVIVNTKENPKRIETEAALGLSAAPCRKDGRDVTGDCEAEGISSQHHQENRKTRKIVANTDAAPATPENEATLEFSRVLHQQEDKHIMKESEAEAATQSHHQEVHAVNEDLGNKREKVIFNHQDSSEPNTVNNNSSTVDNPKLPVDGNVCGQSEAPGDCGCLKKLNLWKKNSTNGQLALGGSDLPKMGTFEGPQKADNDLMRKTDTHEKQASEINNHDKFVSRSTCTNQKDISSEVEDMTSPEAMARHFFLKEEGAYSAEGIYQILDENMVAELGASRVNPVDQCLGNKDDKAHVKPISAIPNAKTLSSDRITKDLHSRQITDHSNYGKDGATTELQTRKEHLKPMGSVGSSQKSTLSTNTKHVDALESEHRVFREEDEKSTHCMNAATLRPVKAEPLDFKENPLLKKFNFRFSVPSATQTWLELPKLPSSVARKKKRDRKVLMLKDPMKRVWPVIYHESIRFTGFATGWRTFVTANNLQQGDLCELSEEIDEEETVYRVQMTKE